MWRTFLLKHRSDPKVVRIELSSHCRSESLWHELRATSKRASASSVATGVALLVINDDQSAAAKAYKEP